MLKAKGRSRALEDIDQAAPKPDRKLVEAWVLEKLDTLIQQGRELPRPPQALPDELSDAEQAQGQLAALAQRRPVTSTVLDEARELLNRMRLALDTANDTALLRLKTQATRLSESAGRLMADERLAEALPPELAPLQDSHALLLQAVQTLSNTSLSQAELVLQAMRERLTSCKQAIADRLKARADLVSQAMAPGTTLGDELLGALPKQAQLIEDLKQSIRTDLGTDPLTHLLVSHAEQTLAQLTQKHQAVLQAVKDLGGPQASTKLKGAFKDSEDLDAFIDKVLGGNHKSMGTLLATVCSGDVSKLKALGESFADDADRERLGAVLNHGGLADKPEALSALLTQGCDGDMFKFKAFVSRLGDAKDPQMSTPAMGHFKAVLDGGLGAAPGLLAEVFKHNTPVNPGDADIFGSFCATFGPDPTSLDHLLSTAGFAATTPPPPVQPKALALMLSHGCDGDPAKLLALAQSGDAAKVKNLLLAGGLGQEPEALGQTFKLGCGQSPARLAALHDAFESAGGAGLARLKSLLDDGNFKQDPNMLADVLSTGCQGNPTHLASLAEGFDGNMPQLKEMVDLWQGDAGSTLATLTDARHLNGDFAQVQSKFAAKLNAPPLSQAQRQRLIQSAGQFKRTAFVDDHALNASLTAPFGLPPGELDDYSSTDCDHLLAHVCERHLPSHFAFKHAKASSSPIVSKNTQFDPSWTPQKAADVMKAALISTAGKAALNLQKVALEAWVVRRDLHKASQAYAPLRADYPSKGHWQAHEKAHQDYLDYMDWAHEVSKVNPKFNQVTLWGTYQHVLGQGRAWKAPVPLGPPCAWPTHPWAHEAPPPWEDDPGIHPPPGGKPWSPKTFTHANIEFQVGVTLDGTDKPKITQFVPVSATAPESVAQFDKTEMESLRDAMVP